jgi:7-carboxy-7-deazaguanine synthase
MLKVNEIFKSVCGEGTELGQIAVFVRLTGCDMRCAYPCDTQYSFYEGTDYSVDELVEKIKSFGTRRTFFTGGEPMMQEKELREVVEKLPRYEGWKHILQTNGKHFLEPALLKDLELTSIDFKGPSAGPAAVSNEEVIRHALLEAYHPIQIKFLVKDDADFKFAKEHIYTLCSVEGHHDSNTSYIVGPVGGLDMRELAERVLADEYLGVNENVRVGCQVHKLLWGNKRGV